MDLIKFSVPGNLLLMGEYVILEEGGEGIAITIPIRAYFTFKKSSFWRFFCKRRELEEYVQLQDTNDFVFRIFFFFCLNYFHNLDLVPYDVYIDTSHFFFNDGRKKGFGSSSVVAVGLSVGLYCIYNNTKSIVKDEIFHLCLNSYRTAQSNKGSGYDIAASLFGGCLLFKGGILPSYEFIENPCFLNNNDFYLMHGLSSVKTVVAIAKYDDKKECLQMFLRTCKLVMKELVDIFKVDFVKSFLAARDLGLSIGDNLCISAALPLEFKYLEKECVFIKALGAGNETFLVYKPNLDIFKFCSMIPIKLETCSIVFEF